MLKQIIEGCSILGKVVAITKIHLVYVGDPNPCS